MEKNGLLEAQARMDRMERESVELRKQVYFLRRFIAAALVVAVSLLGLAASNSTQLIETQCVSLVDGEGVTRSQWKLTEDGAGLFFFGNEQKPTAAVSTGANGPVVALFNENEAPAAVMSTGGGTTALVMLDQKGKGRVALALDATGTSFVLSDEKEAPRVGAGANKSGTGFFLYDTKGKVSTSLGSYPEGNMLVFADGKEKPRGIMSFSGSEGPRIQLFDAKEKSLWSAP